MPEKWRDSNLCFTLEMPTSAMFEYLESEFVDGRKPHSSTIRKHLYCMTCADHCVMVLRAFLTRSFSPLELTIQELPEHNACMRVTACRDILFPLL